MLLIDDIQFIVGKESTRKNFSILLTRFTKGKSRSSSPPINLQKILKVWKTV